EFKRRNVTDVVRVCEPTYTTNLFEENGIHVHDWPFKDGGVPPQKIVTSWLSLCDERFGGLGTCEEPNGKVIAVHCVAGLGRAPILVAMSLIEGGLSPLDAVEYIRRRRRGALNSVQLQYLVESYKKQWYTKRANLTLGGFLSKRSSPVLSSSSIPNNQTGGSSFFGKGDKQNSSRPEFRDHEGQIEVDADSQNSIVESLGKMFRFRKSNSSQSATPATVGGSVQPTRPVTASV
ncbi:Protein tyrosine phosphatase type IVA 1, partial [Nowakowskiella sp. JEL0078]